MALGQQLQPVLGRRHLKHHCIVGDLEAEEL